jgi:hypothetical protein
MNDQMDFDPDDLVGKEFVAKVLQRTGKKSGSFTGWNTYMSLNPPKKKKKRRDAEDTPASEQAAQDLTEAEWAQAQEAVR